MSKPSTINHQPSNIQHPASGIQHQVSSTIMNNPILEVENLSKSFETARHTLQVLKDISFSINRGATLSVVGPSGSGKSTLLGLCAGLDLPDSGSIKIAGSLINHFSEDERAELRNKFLGFVFQSFQLIPTLTALENVMVPLELRNESDGVLPRAQELLAQVGLANRSHHYPVQLSGGEQQRVGLARAFINQPKILFADEPTGNLDNETGTLIADLLFDLNEDFDTTLIIVTHDLELAQRSDRVITLKSGQIA